MYCVPGESMIRSMRIVSSLALKGKASATKSLLLDN